MICSLSGEVPENPVLSKTGYIFERRLVEKYLDNNGKCPHTGEAMTRDDLISIHDVNKVVKPRPIAATSIPGMLALFQNEWDASMLETFTLKQQLSSVRQELSHALYQHDAACRVIARLIKERDEARSQFSNFQTNPVAAAGGVKRVGGGVEESMDVDNSNGMNLEEVKKKEDDREG